jgi:hypothetical protein
VNDDRRPRKRLVSVDEGNLRRLPTLSVRWLEDEPRDATVHSVPAVASVSVPAAVVGAMGAGVSPRPARPLSGAEEGLRSLLAAGAMLIATDDGGLSGGDAVIVGLLVWCAVGWLLAQRP